MPDPGRIVTQLDLSAEEEFQLHIERGRRALNQGNLIEAKAEIDRCLAMRPQDSGALNLRALLLFKLEEYDEALHIFRGLVERYPDEAVLRTSLGLAYMKKNDFESAMAQFEKATHLDRNYSRAHNYLGICYQNLGRLREARDEFLLGGSRSMAAKMEELIAAQQAATTLATPTLEKGTSAPEAQAAVQETIDRLINEPEPEKTAFTGIDKGPVSKEISRGRDPISVLRNLRDVKTRFAVHFDSDAPCAVSEEGVLRVRGQGFSRLRDVIAHVGNLEFRPRLKRYKGKDLKTPFGSEADPIHELVGEGAIYARPSGNLFVLALDDEIIYLQEDRVWAFAGDLRWENGRLPGENGGGDLLLVQFKGTGHIALRLEKSLRILELDGSVPAQLPAEIVVGWFGETVPRLTTIASGGQSGVVVELKGSGHVLFELAMPPAVRL